ncbi:MAG: CCA tRNA nucleotidyltransferase [Tissierellia bacterium]|nr:CCA tRNA nucleotidyltransferase [Tissierellia bacterium]
MKIPQEIAKIINTFDGAGAQVYLVGGSVRDSLLGLEVHDYDLATNLEPDQVEELFFNYPLYKVGKKFGTLGIVSPQGLVEVTTYREDGAYEGHRKPKEVTFSKSLEEDLRRRDFTINAMAYHPQRGLVDLFDGRGDLEKRILRTVGDPNRRFREDGLRILRGLRFMGQLDFRIDHRTQEAMKNNRDLIDYLSRERIRDEVFKILVQDKPSRVLYKMLDLGILEKILPSLMATVGFDQKTPYHDKTLFDHILCVVDRTPRKLNVRLAALFHDIEKPATLSIDQKTGRAHFFGHDSLGAQRAEEILRAYRASKKDIDSVKALISDHMKVHQEMSDRALRRQIRRVGEDNVLDLYDLMLADMACTVPGRDQTFLLERKKRIEDLLAQGLPDQKSLKINGRDLMDLGLEEGPQIGQVLRALEEELLDDPDKNKRDYLLDRARLYIREIKL